MSPQSPPASREPAPLDGGCLCGAVRFVYRGPLGGALGAVTVCHCAMCRAAQGYGCAVAPALAEAYQVTRGRDEIAEYESSPGKRRAFCRRCGSPLYSRRDAAPEALRLRLGAVDALPEGLAVQAHIFTRGAPSWSFGDDAPRYPGLEPGRGRSG